MPGRYLRTMVCEDCGNTVTRMWHAGRARVCLSCGISRSVCHNLNRADAARRRREERWAEARGAPSPQDGATEG
jgi:hypothetical protein